MIQTCIESLENLLKIDLVQNLKISAKGSRNLFKKLFNYLKLMSHSR